MLRNSHLQNHLLGRKWALFLGQAFLALFVLGPNAFATTPVAILSVHWQLFSFPPVIFCPLHSRQVVVQRTMYGCSGCCGEMNCGGGCGCCCGRFCHDGGSSSCMRGWGVGAGDVVDVGGAGDSGVDPDPVGRGNCRSVKGVIVD